MITDEQRQQLIVRQSSLKVAADLLINSSPGTVITLESLFYKADEIARWVMKPIEEQPKQKPVDISREDLKDVF